MFELWLNSYSLYATFESHSTSAQRSGQNFRISHHNFTDMNTPIDQYLGIVNPLLIITRHQVDLDIPNLKAMCTMWLVVHRHRVKVCDMLLKITLMISSLRIPPWGDCRSLTLYTVIHLRISGRSPTYLFSNKHPHVHLDHLHDHSQWDRLLELFNKCNMCCY